MCLSAFHRDMTHPYVWHDSSTCLTTKAAGGAGKYEYVHVCVRAGLSVLSSAYLLICLCVYLTVCLLLIVTCHMRMRWYVQGGEDP